MASNTKVLTMLLFCFLQTYVMLSAAETKLDNYESLTKAIESGLSVRFIQNYGECDFDFGSGPAPNASSGGSISNFYVNKEDKSIHYTSYKLIYNYQSPTGGYVYDFGETVIHPNGTVFIKATDLVAPDPNSREAFYSETFTCQLGSSIHYFASDEKMSKPVVVYQDMFDTVQTGAELRVTWTPEMCKPLSPPKQSMQEIENEYAAQGIFIDTFEAFDDPDFGPPKLSWSTLTLTNREVESNAGSPAKTMWVLRQIITKINKNDNSVDVVYTDLSPVTLEAVPGSLQSLKCDIKSGAVKLFTRHNS